MIAARLSGQRLHLQHGPIDLIIGADGDRAAAFAAATARFEGLLERLAEELPLLRSASGAAVKGPVAQRMARAVAPHQIRGFVTPMAAVAGAVADEILQAIATTNVGRAYVNNGGDIALFLTGGARFDVGMADFSQKSVWKMGFSGARRLTVAAQDGVRGIATSGQGGRSLSLGIAQSVTVLARTAAEADVAATLIGNAVDLPGSASIRRVPARDLQPDSDLGERLVVTSVGALSASEVQAALRAGILVAEDMAARGLIVAAALSLRGEVATVGEMKGRLADA